jgi:hypothetical protein
MASDLQCDSEAPVTGFHVGYVLQTRKALGIGSLTKGATLTIWLETPQTGMCFSSMYPGTVLLQTLCVNADALSSVGQA